VAAETATETDATATDATPTAATAATAPPADGTPSPTPVEQAQAWQNQLAPELRTNGTLGRYKSIDDLAKAHIEQHKVLSTSVVKPPGADAKPEEVQRFRDAIGVPKMPSDYQLPEKLDPTLEQGFRTAAHKLGIPTTVAQGLADWYLGAEKERIEAQDTVWRGELDKLKAEWGEGEYNQKERAAVRFIEAMAQEAGFQVPEVKQWLNETRLGNHPTLFRLLATAGEKMLEKRMIAGDQSAINDVKAQIEVIRSDPNHPLNPANHRGDPTKRMQWDDLYRQAYPNTG
jgi:hypothetical protein